ncbi:MAG: class I SAM-dependent methyltransferase [Blautia sp.]|nr:class I SAM-dependent methyltransferase [Eubacteriales bacterium]MED9967239.1 class I SAM-dependent methyltransferase [Blautia sp.]
MEAEKKNYYGSLCTELYEILHEKAPEDELDFYVSYAEKGKKILEPLCGSGRFLVPFLERGFDICGIDLSEEMLMKLKEKASNARVRQADLSEYSSEEKYDYIFISSGSVSLFTDIELCKKILGMLKNMLAPEGKLVFAVDTVANVCQDDKDYREDVAVKTKEGYTLVLKTKNHYDAKSQTQYSPGLYELYDGETLIQSELMDFQTHLYKFGEMEQHLKELGFIKIKTYASFSKKPASGDGDEMFLFECSAD